MIRLRSLFALGAVMAAATAFAGCGGGGDPQALVRDSTLLGVRSGHIDLSLHVKASGDEGGNLDISLLGPFEAGEKGDLPQFDMTAEAKGSLGREDVDFEAGLTLLPPNAFINYEGTDYEVTPAGVELFSQEVEARFVPENELVEPSACQDAIRRLKFSDYVEHLRNEGSADVGGTSTTKVSADLDVPGMLASVDSVLKFPDCAAQLGATDHYPSTHEWWDAERELKEVIRGGHVALYVGDDDIVREISVRLALDPKPLGYGPENVDLSFDLKLTQLDEEQQISAPQNAKSGQVLLGKLGIKPLELIGVLNGRGVSLGRFLEQIGVARRTARGQSRLRCLRDARTVADVQRCAALLE